MITKQNCGYLLSSAIFLIVPSFAGSRHLGLPGSADARVKSRPPARAAGRRIMSSGLTPEQIRARLRAEGYPEDLLDQYLPGGAERASRTQAPPALPDDVSAPSVPSGSSTPSTQTYLRCSVESLDTTARGVADTIKCRTTEPALANKRAARTDLRGAIRERRLTPADSARSSSSGTAASSSLV